MRAFGDEPRMLALADARVDSANRSLHYLWATNQWLRVTMNLVGSLVSGAVVGTVLWQAGSLRGGDAGLTLSYATQFVQGIMWLFRIYTQLEVSMNDVERVEEYTHDLPTEDYECAAAGPVVPSPPLASWPTEGAIEFCDVRLQCTPPPPPPPQTAAAGSRGDRPNYYASDKCTRRAPCPGTAG